jgi:uncharacterized membrane protein
MVMLAAEGIGILMRWAHIVSVVLLIGGMIYARMVVVPVLARADDGERPEIFEWLAARHRPLVCSALAGLLVSGIYTIVAHRGHTSYYHMWFGIKMLLALHVFAASLLAVKSAPAGAENEAKRVRRITGVVLSGLLIILISAYLRRIY